MKRKFSDSFKELVVKESFTTEVDLKKLAEKYDIEVRLLKSWRKSHEHHTHSIATEQGQGRRVPLSCHPNP
ncbi:MAG TPA: transposase [Bacteroidia bacterium]|nr:transposase [Bacteroidia bacterium]